MKKGSKREATITAGALCPRYLRTYARPAPVNRAKRARLRERTERHLFFFYCIAELAIKPCRSSRSKTRGGLRNSTTLAKRKQNTTKQTTKPKPNSPNTNTNKQKHGKCHWMVRQVVKKKVKRPKRPNALIC